MNSPAFVQRIAAISPRVTHGSRGFGASLTQPRWAIAFFMLGLAIAFVYLVLVNDTATTGLTLESLEQDVAKIKAESRQLEIELANLQSFSTLERASQALDLTEVVVPEFVTAPSDAFASR